MTRVNSAELIIGFQDSTSVEQVVRFAALFG